MALTKITGAGLGTITGKTGMGISSTDVPDGGLHVHTGSSGSVSANAHADELVIESSGRGGISLLTPDANESNILFGSPSDNLGGFITYKQSNTTMELGTSIASGLVKVNVADGTLNTTFEADGDVNISNGNLVVASGHGIDFSATSDGTTMSSELLDDYEEGIITVGINVGGGSAAIDSTNNHLVYTKIGRVVYITGAIQLSAESGTTSSHYIQFTGMPFSGAADFDGLAGRSVGYISHDGATVTDGDDLVGVVNEGGAVINLYRQNETGHNLGGGEIDSNSVLYFNFHYFTT